MIDLDQHRQTIATRVIPSLRNVSVDWIDCGNQTGVLVIDIPAQPQSSQLFAVPAPTGTADVSKTAVGVPVRRGDGTTWLRPHEIQHFIALGVADSGDGMDKLAAALASIRAPQPVEKSERTLGGGAPPGWKGIFHQAVNDLYGQGIFLGTPVSDAEPIGPGWAQYFETPTELFGWVLCVQPNQRAVAVLGEIWQSLLAEGSGVPGGDALGALGFPTGDPETTLVVGRDSTTVPLSGGQWGLGHLHRHGAGQSWRWEPEPAPGTTMSASIRNWPPPVPAQLRARVLATLPWADITDVKITPDRLDAVLPQLPHSRLAEFTMTLSARRGRHLPATPWNQGPNNNASDRLSYSSAITNQDGEPVLTAEVMMSLPPAAMSSVVVTCAEVRIEDFAAWAKALGAEPTADLRWSTEDMLEFFVAAWDTATELLPRLAAEDSTKPRRWSAVPQVELWIGTDQPHGESGTQLVLEDVLDLSPLGHSGQRGQRTELLVSSRSVPGLDADTQRSQARLALVEMAHRFGFMSARATSF